MFDIIGKRFWFLLIAGIVILISIISLIGFGLKAGVEFSSGSILTIRFEEQVEQEQLKQEVANLGHPSAIIQRTGAGDFLIRTRELSGAEKTQLENDLMARFGPLTEAERTAAKHLRLRAKLNVNLKTDDRFVFDFCHFTVYSVSVGILV